MVSLNYINVLTDSEERLILQHVIAVQNCSVHNSERINSVLNQIMCLLFMHPIRLRIKANQARDLSRVLGVKEHICFTLSLLLFFLTCAVSA
jgi:hypothetical protein